MVKSYKCMICGYVHIGEQPPEGCIVCGAPASEFELCEEKVEDKKVNSSSWRCVICGYIHVGSNPPEICHVCGVGSENFEACEDSKSSSINAGKMKIIIIGGGIAGLSAAEEIRKNSNDAQITLISQEEHLPYYRVNLTKYLAKQMDRSSLDIYPRSWYDKNHINLILGREVCEIYKDAKQVELDDGNLLDYDKLVIAAGASPFVPPIKGNNLRKVMTVRRVEDIDYILKEMHKINSCVCIGGGILGIEVAGAIANHGVKVTLLENSDWLMHRQLNKKASTLLKRYLSNIGIEVKENAGVKEVIGKEFCEGVRLNSDEVLDADLVIITAGVRPNISLAEKFGLIIGKGLVSNDFMQTSEKDIYAAGDVTEHKGTLYGLWNAAQYQGKIAAMNAIGIEAQFGGIPRSNALKVLGLEVFSIGEFNLIDESYYQYEREDTDRYCTFVFRNDKIVGSIIIGDNSLAVKVKQAIEKGSDFPRESYHDVENIIKKLELSNIGEH